ncbi:MAG: S-layer homology domain-containing protein [Faecousia sp.]
MKKRILSILLILCMVLSMLPLSAFATGAANHLTVLETAPATATVAAGSLYELDLSTVFADSEGHTLTYALSGGDFGEHTKIADGKLAFTVSTAGEYKPTITATCSEGDFVSHTVTITVTEAAEGSDRQYGYDETPAASVTVYVTISNDGMPILSSNDTNTVIAMLPVTVPYFDLKLYGLEDYYRCHTEDGQGSYVDDDIVERPTMLHLYIYLLERYYMGLPEKDCCKGTSGVLNYTEETSVSYFVGEEAYSSNSQSAVSIGGTATSMFMNEFWGHDCNLKYYRNHAYPLMSPGWGSTADYILLSDGDTIDIGLFTDWGFYMNGEFCCFSEDAYTGEAGSELTASLLRWNATDNNLEAFADMDIVLCDAKWTVLDVLDSPAEDGTVTFTLPETAGTYYILAMDYCAATTDAVNAPAVARLEVTEPPIKGYLSDLHFTVSSGATSARYELSPAYSEDNLTYTMLVPDSKSGAYAWATLSENAPEGSTITAKWAGTNGSDRSITITSGKSSGQWMAYFLNAGSEVNTVTIEVGVEGDMQIYAVQAVRIQPTLTALSLVDIPFNESFSATTFNYTTATLADSITINATPRDESYTVTYNGSESNVVALNDGENSISVKIVNAGGYESVYTITVNKASPISIRFDVTPADAVVNLQDSFGDRVWAEDGIYTLMSGCTYSYTVTKNGYIGQKNSFTLTESGTIEIALEKAPENAAIDTTIYAQWGVFRGENNLGITDAPTPYTPEDAEVLWAAKWGTGWAAAPNPPIIVDGDLIVIVSSSIKRVDRNTGEVKVEGTMAGTCGFGIITPTYGDGMIFVPLSGKLQAFNAETLESLWVYTDPLGGQPNCTVAYEDGYAYVGWWGSETKNANFACVSVTDEDPGSTNEAKLATWTYTRAGGFYWAGAYTTDKYVLVGTDDGQSGYSSETASLLIFDRFTGELLDSQDGIRGDIRSNISYDPSSDRIFFTSKGGVLCNAKIDWSTGKITDFQQIVLKDSKGNEYAMSTCTPCVYNDRIYIGVAGTSQFGDFSGHGISVFDLNEDGSMMNAYVYDIKGYPQSSAMVTTAYADEDEGYVYIYQTYNTTPGGISVLKDKKGQTEPITTTDAGYSEVFTPVTPLSQYCLASVIADEYGTIYYKNDSCYTIALTSKIESIEITCKPTGYHRNEDGTWTAESLAVSANLKNGLQRDVTDYIVITESEETGSLVISYTYGFDSDNYGLKTLTIDLCSLCTAAGHDFTLTVVGATCASDGYTLHTCSRCGYNYRDQFAPALGHAYEEAVTAPTCTAQGYTTYTCKTCGHGYIDSVIAALGHDCEVVVTAPTCTAQGYTTYTCKVCGHSYVDSVIPAAGHDFITAVTEPTHDEMGYTTHTCKACDYSYVDSYTDALGHAYVGEFTKEPTCTEEGEMTFTCACGKSYTQTVPVIAHEYETAVTAPTCTALGFTTYACKICGHSYKADYVNAISHDCENTVVEPTCVGYGYTVSACKHCDYSVITDLRQPLGHKYTLQNAREATCTEEGYTGDRICERCGDVQSQGKVIAVSFDDCPTASFTDLDAHEWYHAATDFVLRNGYMLGASETAFEPDTALTRGQLVAILYRVSGSPDTASANPFKDVAENSYYRNAIVWAYENGIALGVSADGFAPDEAVTREQMVTFFARYAAKNGATVSDGADLSAYKDGAKISAYAAEAMAWAVKNGIVNGVSADLLDPQGTATRVQAAAIVQRLCALLAAK